MAGKEVSGIEHAEADLFRDTVWLITPIDAAQPYTPRQQEYLELLTLIGARVVALETRRHDRLCAWVSQLLQMMATALACVLREELGDGEAVVQIGGRALREMTRIAHSPYSMWRDIALTNTANIEEALQRLEQRLAHIRDNLKTRGLEEEFDRAHRFKKV